MVTGVFVDVDNCISASRAGLDPPPIREIVDGLLNRDDQCHFTFVGTTDNPEFQVQLNGLPDTAEIIGVRRQGRKSPVDTTLTIRAVQLLSSIDAITLVSGDNDFVALLDHATSLGVETEVVGEPGYVETGLALAADVRTDWNRFRVKPLSTLIEPGTEVESRRALKKILGEATCSVMIIDPYTTTDTLSLLAWCQPTVTIELVGGRGSDALLQELELFHQRGRTFSLWKSTEVHDRWFKVDDTWWHSGGSLKDLGRKWERVSRIGDEQEILQHEAMLSALKRQSQILFPTE